MTTNPSYMKMKDVYLTPHQDNLLNTFLAGKDNVAMMLSIKWKRPYINSEIVSRSNSTFTNLDPHLKDIVQQLAFRVACEFKKKHAAGKLITSYKDIRPTVDNPNPRGMMAMYSKHDTARNEHDYWFTFGDTGKDNFQNIINGYGTEVGVGQLLTPNS